MIAPAPRRSRWPIFLPVLIFIVLAAAWSAFWWVAASRAGDAIDVWLKREAEKGRVYSCADKRLIGYPFRVELVCDGPTARLPGDGGDVTASAPSFKAVAQVYDPRHLIGELAGPVAITAPDGRQSTLSFALAQASAQVDQKTVERASVVLTAPRLVSDGLDVGAAKSLQAHMRRTSDGVEGSYDFAVKVDDAAAPALDRLPIGAGPVSAELQAKATGLEDLRPQPTSERLRAFAAAGGRVHVAFARASRGDVAVEARGDLALDPEGRVDAALDVVARGMDGVVQGLIGGGKKSAIVSFLGVGAQLLGAPAELDGKRANTYHVTAEKGRVSIGPIRVYKLPPVF